MMKLFKITIGIFMMADGDVYFVMTYILFILIMSTIKN